MWLAIDTATDRASVAAGVPPAVGASASVTGSRRHAAQIVRLIDQVLGAVGVTSAKLAGIVVSDGPGSFTGLRIGWATAKALAQEREIPLRAVPALLAAARGAVSRTGPGPVAACFDALRGQVFGAVYAMGGGGESIATIVPPTLATVTELAKLASVTPLAVVGDGAVRYADDVRAWCGAAPVPLEELSLGAESLLTLVARPEVGRTIDATSEPVYGRPAEAQARWEARHGRALPNPTGHGG